MNRDQPDIISEFQRVGHELVDSLSTYLQACYEKSIPVTVPVTPEASFEYWNQRLNDGKTSIDLFSDILEKSIHLHHKGYVGHQVAAAHPITIYADLLGSLLNNGMAVYEMGQVSVAMERVICQFLAKHLAWDNKANGFFTSGGSLANLTALLTARQVHSQNQYWAQGAEKKYAVMVSTEAHYCIERAVKIMGLGNEGIIHIPVNQNFQMQVDQLEQNFNKATQKGIDVFAVVANAGSTSTGSYDDIDAIAQFCKSKNLWLHVDGAHGGAVLISKKYKDLVKGIEHANSFVLDFHKLLQTPIVCTALVYKDASTSFETFTQGAKYLFSDQSQEWYQLGKQTFECTKPMMVLKAYTVLHQLGEEGLAASIEDRYALALIFANMIKRDAAFELAVIPQSNIVCFRYIFNEMSLESLNKLNQEIRQKIISGGQFYLVQTQIKDKIFLRCSLMNIGTTVTELEKLIESIKINASELLRLH